MLNEKQEYRQYTFTLDPDSELKPENMRLQYKALISNGFSGLERAMVIVARKFLFESDESINEDRAKLALRIWCGGKPKKGEEIDSDLLHIQNWLPNYIRFVFLKSKICDFLGDISEMPKLIISFVEEIEQDVQEQRIDGKCAEVLAQLEAFSKEARGKEYEAIYDEYVAPISKSISRLAQLKYQLSDRSPYDQVKLTEKIESFQSFCNKRSNRKVFQSIFESVIQSIRVDAPEEELKQKATELTDLFAKAKDGVEGIEFNMLKSMYESSVIPIVKTINALEVLANKRKHFGHSMFYTSMPSHEVNSVNNDFKAITYDGILAKAYNMGPLKSYYLCYDDSSQINIVSSDKDRDILLKTVAAWLLGKRFSRGGRYAAVNKTDISNWLHMDVENYTKKAEIKKDKSGHILFRFQKVGTNAIKLMIGQHGKKLEDSFSKHFSLIEESDIAQWAKDHPTGVFFSDNAYSLYLTENVRYEEGE